jgi:mRNA interferase RelE/StbE
LTWRIEIVETARKQIHKLDKPSQRKIISLLKILETNENPRLAGKALHGDKAGLWRYRSGDYRIICQIMDSTITILVLKIGHRREVYR